MDIKVYFNDKEYNVNIEKKGDEYTFNMGDNLFDACFHPTGKNQVVMNVGSKNITADFLSCEDKTVIYIEGERYEFKELRDIEEKEASEIQENIIKAPMPGLIIKIGAEKGKSVKKGDILVILEAMKMQHELRSKSDMVIKDIFVKEGEQVDAFATLVELSPLK